MAYDEVNSLNAYKQFADRATRELLCIYTSKIIKPFIDQIWAAQSKAEVSRVMTNVRRAI